MFQVVSFCSADTILLVVLLVLSPPLTINIFHCEGSDLKKIEYVAQVVWFYLMALSVATSKLSVFFNMLAISIAFYHIILTYHTERLFLLRIFRTDDNPKIFIILTLSYFCGQIFAVFSVYSQYVI